MMIEFRWYTCPNGHKFLVLEEDRKKGINPHCPYCRRSWTWHEGIAGRIVREPEAFPNLRG